MTWRQKRNTKGLEFLLKFRNFRPEKCLIICSSTRSGSTWLMEMIGKIPGTLLNWEPFHKEHGIVPEKFNWPEHPKISINSQNHDYKKFIDKTLSLKLHSPWTLQFMRYGIWPNLVVTKSVRCIQMLPWMLLNYKFEKKPILLLRHPIATCKSQIKAFGKDIHISIDEVPSKEFLEIFPDFPEYAKQFNDPLEKRLLMWCARFVESLNNESVQKKCYWVFYEDILIDPKMEMSKILDEYGIAAKRKLLKKMKFRKRSKTDFKKDFSKKVNIQIGKYSDNLDAQALANIQRIFDYFDFTLYSSTSPLPNKKSIPFYNEKSD